jgi:hypothetical protein
LPVVWGVEMDHESKIYFEAMAEWENRKAAVAVFRAALSGKADWTAALSPGVLRARRRELESSCEYLTELAQAADRAGARVRDLARRFRRNLGAASQTDMESGVT